jgi:hypothetical protein
MRRRSASTAVLALCCLACAEPRAGSTTAAAPTATSSVDPTKGAEAEAPDSAASSAANPSGEPPRIGPLDRWTIAGEAPLAGLYFGMSFEEVWELAPQLRDAIDVRLEAATYDALMARYPVLKDYREGGGDFDQYKHHHGSWPTVAGARWELYFYRDRGLTWVTVRFADEASLRAAIAGWGRPDLEARWEFWFDEASGIRAAFTGCHSTGPDDAPECKLEFMPMQSPEAFVGWLFPAGKTRVGAELQELGLGAGERMAADEMLYTMTPLPTDLYAPLQVQFDDSGRIRAYKTQLSNTYDDAARERNERALTSAVGDLREDGLCRVGAVDGQPVSVCAQPARLVLTIGKWE